jgi:ribosomal protein L7/L12
MKLTITKTDILNIINEKFNLNLKMDEMEIVNAGTNYEVALRQAVKEFAGVHNKISAIKCFRELMTDVKTGGSYPIGVGLAEAKYAVENVENAIVEHNSTGKIPCGTFN